MKLYILLLGFININLWAQDSIVTNIDSICTNYDNEIKMAIEEELDFLPPKFTITSTLMMRAIGEVNSKTTLYFDVIEKDDIDDYGNIDTCVLRKIDVELQSGSYFIHKQYYFNSDGNLIFHKIHDEGYDCWEQSYYYLDSTCIQINQKPLSVENCNLDVIAESFKHTKLTQNEITTALSILKGTMDYKTQLNILFKLNY